MLRFRISHIFWTYWAWHMIVMLFQSGIISLPKGSGPLIASFSLLSLLYICTVPFEWYSRTKRFTTHEGSYMEAVKITIYTRLSMMIIGTALTIHSIYWVLAFDGAVLALYYFLKLYRRFIFYRSSRMIRGMFPYRIRLRRK